MKTSETLCPTCSQPLAKEGDLYHCASCTTHYRESITCPVCDQEVEVLKACGAVNYFCTSCNELQSKHNVIKRYVAL